ncbi:hypothetical protein [Novosphingobium sp. TCA1]|nr:hypothetical protein [Novosphingobium sp. TCA1]
MTVDMESLVKSRLIFFVGVNTGFVTDNLPDERYINFYARRSSPLLYCAILGNVVVPDGFGSNAQTPVISDNPVWQRVASAIADRGALPGIQLASAWSGYTGNRRFRSNSPAAVIESARKLLNEMSEDQQLKFLDSLEHGTELALDAGFRHIQLHAAHGYLFNLLIDQRFNSNAPSVLDRLRAWAIKLKAQGVETSIRISLRSGEIRFDQVGGDEFVDKIAQLPFDYVDVSSGFYNIDKKLIYPGRPDTITARWQETLSFARRHPNQRFIYSGRAITRPKSELPLNVHLGVCRDLIANPDFLQQSAKGCENSGHCHYFSRGQDHVTCSQWLYADRHS